MIGFFIAVGCFALILTAIARFSNMKVREPIKGNNSTVLTFIFIGLMVFGWWFVTNGNTIEERVLVPLILPSPVEVLNAFPRLHMEQGLVRSVGISFQRVGTGFSLAIIAALSLGVYMAAFSGISAFFRPLALIGSYIPIVCLVPLSMAWWGGGEMQKVGFLFIACFVVLLPLVMKAINNVGSAYIDVAKTKGATQWQLVKNVLVPVAMPDIWDHLRGVYGVGWGWIILAEVVNSQNGLGYLMSISERRGQTASIFAIIIVIVLVATICDKIWKTVGENLFPHRIAQ
jgi:ABC-type nitrate/sulfonate/bicarbonate transport system permease component